MLEISKGHSLRLTNARNIKGAQFEQSFCFFLVFSSALSLVSAIDRYYRKREREQRLDHSAFMTVPCHGKLSYCSNILLAALNLKCQQGNISSTHQMMKSLLESHHFEWPILVDIAANNLLLCKSKMGQFSTMFIV